jgi:NAD(P)-dependent dehydrogenase (short-subunit alcohol dehydrogenase family)
MTVADLSPEPRSSDRSGTADFSLDGRVALVTGAARGLGAAIATAMAGAGADVVLGVRSEGSADRVAAEIRALGRRAVVSVFDVTDLAASRSAIDTVIGDVGGIDILVNNAGGGIEEPAIDIAETHFDRVIELNVKSALFLSQHVARHLRDRGAPGRIVNISSQAGLVALPGETSYCIAKAAVSHMTRCLAIEWGEHGINVNSISPTFIETPGTAPALSDPDFRADTIDRIAALHRIGQPIDVAGAAVFLASPAAAMITGHDLVIDGGWTIR